MLRQSPVAGTGGRAATLVTLLLLALFAVYLQQAGALQPLVRAGAAHLGLAAPAPAERRLQAFFTTPTLVYPDKAWQRPAVPLLQRFVTDIDAARASADLASFDFDLAELADALLRAHRRGVLVRLVVDSENLLAPEVSAQLGRLERAGIAVQLDRREPFMHNKFAVFDGRVAWFGSWNMTENDTFRNNNNMIRAADARLAADYTYEIEQMLGGRFGKAKARRPEPRALTIGAARVQLFFSPQDAAAPHLIERLAGARRSIRVLAFSFTAAPMIDLLVAQARAGVLVQGVLETQNATGRSAGFERLRDGGADVLLDGNCYNMHHKVIVIDEQTVITGSYNFTNSAEQSNDENVVIIDDRALASAYLEEFQRVYAQAQSPLRCV